MRDESAALLSAIGEAIEIGEQGGIKVEVFHLKGAFSLAGASSCRRRSR